MWTALIVFVMAHAYYRRRSDGLVEIVRPGLWRRLGGKVPAKRLSAAALALLVVGAAGFGLYAALGATSVVLLASLGLAAALWRGRRAPRVPATVRAMGFRRTAP